MGYQQRRDALRELMGQRSLDALLVTSPSNRYYLSGFELHDVQFNESAGCLVITSSGKDWLLTDSRYIEAARQFWPEERIFIYKADRAAGIARILGACGTKLGFESACLDARTARRLSERVRLVACDGLVEKLRVHKDKEEREALKKSFALNHAMLSWVQGAVREGMTERELAWAIERYFRENGAEELAFPSIVAYGANAALPHALPSERPLAPETAVLLDVGCRVDAYCSDQTRTFWFGEKPSDFFRVTHDLVAHAQETVLKAMEPGLPLARLAKLATSAFEKAGQLDHFTHGLGHGVGLDTHESPSFNTRAPGVLEPGMTVTVEPGLYYPGKLGVRLEVTVLVEEDGVTIL